MANLFVESEETVYIKIFGDPIFDVYDDEGRIRDRDNELCDKMDNRRDELSLQDNWINFGHNCIEGVESERLVELNDIVRFKLLRVGELEQ
ncbi:hypothetical protein F2Q70_00008891 [Brassica cretica]|uniref:Uncharacterized protein n=1 Tax=Brassica cretica TaxID=69181 RepID=A0A8S9M7C9_BRACR|nr:hypothetical protein F2Q70_00008891 [Brassica cretica]